MAARKPSRLRNLARRAVLAARYERLARARRSPIDDNTVFYESFSGNGMLCNPEAIFRALLAADDLGHLRHVWALRDLDEYAATVAEFAGNSRVTFVKYDTPAYYGALAKAKYLVNNATFPPQFGKRDGQIYINTWHGTPLKAMGYDIPGGAMDTRNVVRNFVSADYLLAPNDDTAEMYLTAYRMRNIYRGAIVHEGSPRVDRQFVSDDERARIRSRLRERGVTIDEGQRVIVYAPTWRGDFYGPTNDIRQLRARVEMLASQIQADGYRVLLKVHQQVYKYAAVDSALGDMLVPNELPTNEVLAAADVLITDYSSIFVDFLATGRPVLFFTPDLDDYKTSRGLYVSADEWPGPICRDMGELVQQVKRLHTGGDDDPAVAYAQPYAEARKRYCPAEDGKAAARIIDIAFRGRTEGFQVRRDFSDGRTSILIHLGGLLPNGISSSALCLLNNIDHDRFDVSVTFPYSTKPERQRVAGLINPNVRLFPRIGGINGGKLAVRSLLAVKRRSPARQARSAARHKSLLRDEWVRCYGASEFDVTVDFSGYAPFWAKVGSQSNSGSYAIWLHNDMHAELENAGRSAWLRASVQGMFGMYSMADHLVSVSPALAEVNRKNLTRYAPAERFTYAHNTIDGERILHLAFGEPAPAEPYAGVEAASPHDLTGSVGALIDYHGIGHVVDEVTRRATLSEILPAMPAMRTFVTAGRLSPEKNHRRLVRAFDLVHQEDPNTRLVILGSGALRERLEELVEELGLTAAVTLAGHQPNPYVVLANSDCFVLSSDYEGQPMVLLEALILGLPVVTTKFGSVEGALPEGYGLVTPRTVEGLAEGMRGFLRGDVPTHPFDAVQYNKSATEEFYRAIGAA